MTCMTDVSTLPLVSPQPAALLDRMLDVVDALVVVCRSDGTIVRFNRKCERLTGYSAVEVLGTPLWDLIPTDEVGSARGAFDKVYAGEFPNRHINSWKTKEHEPVLISWNSDAIIGNKGRVEYVISTGVDITEKKSVEASFRTAIDSMEDGFALYDANERLVAVNEAFWTFFGDLRPHIRIGMRFQEIGHEVFHNTDLQERYESFEQYWAERSSVRHTAGAAYVREYKPGRFLRSRNFITSDGGFAAFVTDITEGRRYDDTLTGLLKISDNVSLSITERIERMLALGRAHFGMEVGVVSRVAGDVSTIEFLDTDDPVFKRGTAVAIEESYSQYFPEGSDVRVIDDVELSPIGREAPFERKPLYSLVGVPIIVSGAPYGALYFAANKVAARPLSEVDLQLMSLFGEWTEMQIRLDTVIGELDNFAYIASHDLRAPLRAIDNLSQWIEEDAGHALTDDAKNYLSLLRGRVSRLETLLNDLLEYSRAGRVAGEVRPVEIDKVLDDSIMQIGVPEHLAVKVAPNMPVVDADPATLIQIFGNLLSNAIKHHDKDAGSIEISVAERENFWEFLIEDDGPGVQPEFRERIFDIFQTLRPRDEVEGSGMGLAIVKRLVDTAGGRISVSDRAGGEPGAAFRFTWPKSNNGAYA